MNPTGPLAILLNVIWLVFAGFWMAVGYAFFGLIACILIITIPAGVASFRMASYCLWPFGRVLVRRETAGVFSALGNVIWIVFCGFWLALGHVLTSIPLFLSIIGIPMGIANLKLVPVSLVPFGREIVRADQLEKPTY